MRFEQLRKRSIETPLRTEPNLPQGSRGVGVRVANWEMFILLSEYVQHQEQLHIPDWPQFNGLKSINPRKKFAFRPKCVILRKNQRFLFT